METYSFKDLYGDSVNYTEFVQIKKSDYANMRALIASLPKHEELLNSLENQLAHYRRENAALYESIDQARKALEVAVEALLRVTQCQEWKR